MNQPLNPPTLTTPLGTIAKKAFATPSAIEFTRLMEQFADQVRAEHRDQILAEAAKRQRDIASRLPEHLAGAAAIVTTAADVIDPAVKVLFQPARVRDAASDYRDQVLAEGAEILRPLRSVINAQSNPAAYATALLLAARAGSQEQETGQ